MSAELLKRADAIRAQWKKLELTKGSGFHDNDRNPARPELYLAPQREGYRAGDPEPEKWPAKMSERLVAFFDHHDFERVTLVGPDAERALKALKAYHGKLEARLKDAEKRGQDPYTALTGTERKLRHLIPKLATEADKNGPPVLKLWLSEWNDYLAALYAEGLGVNGADLIESTEE